MKPKYQGEAYTHEDIIALLRSRGLLVEDEKRAKHILKNVSITRLTNYFLTLTEKGNGHRFREGVTFEMVYALYGFDRRLRELIFHELEKIEISIRTHIAYACNASENGYWYINPSHFHSEKSHAKLLRHIKMELDRSDNEGILLFKKKYSDEFPPSWIALEAVSMGTLNIIYGELDDEIIKRRISDYYGITPEVFTSWIRHLVSVRNSCAHHNRVWNCKPRIKAIIPAGTANPFTELNENAQNHIYMTLCIIKYLQNVVKPTNSFGCRLKNLIGNFKMIDPSLMGFPKGWEELDFWTDRKK